VRGSCLRGKGAATEKAPRIETVLRNPKAVELTGSNGKLDTKLDTKEEDYGLFSL